MIALASSLKAVGGARGGIAPVHLLDVQDSNGNLYFWSNRRCEAPVAIDVSNVVSADPPVALASGQSIAWSLPTTVTATPPDANGSVAAGLSSAAIRAVGTGNYVAEWGGFPMPSLPPNARIDAIWPVVAVAASGDSDFVGAEVGPYDFISKYDQGTGFNMPIGPEFDGQYTTEFSIGSDASVLTGLNLNVHFARSLGGSFFEQVDVSFIGLAIYYTIDTTASGSAYLPWLLDVPQFSFHRSLQTDTGSFVVQNLSGDTLSRDAEKILRASTLEGALFVYRLWEPAAEAAWLEVHGTLTVDPVGTRDLTLKGSSLINAAQDDTPLEIYCETCQIDWAGRRCGSTQSTECSYSFQSCQVVERIMVVLNHYEKNFGEAAANVTVDRQPNRRRRI